MQTSFQIARVMGIPIKIHITFLLILPVFALVFAINPAPFGFRGIEPPLLNYALSFLTTLLLFGSILLHEIGHSYLAKKYGVQIDNITLFLIGGVSSMEEIPRDPSEEAKMAFAGPLISLVIGFVLLFITFFVIPSFSDNPIYLMIRILGTINVILGIFNLLPAFPMDGGRIVRAWYARKMPYVKATHRAAGVGKFFAFLMAMLGLLAFNPWLLLIAAFVYMGASGEDRSTAVTVTLEKIPVKDMMSRDVISVPPNMNIDELTHFMFENKHMGYPVMEGNVLKGIVTFTDVRTVMPQERPAVLVSDIMTRNVLSIPSDSNAADAFKLMSSRNVGRVMIIDDGSIVGILSRTDLVRTLTLLNE